LAGFLILKPMVAFHSVDRSGIATVCPYEVCGGVPTRSVIDEVFFTGLFFYCISQQRCNFMEKGNCVVDVGDDIKAENASWTFGGNVPRSFDSHVRKSVPLYLEGHELIVRIADYFLQENSTVYELGTSTGELLNKIATNCKKGSVRFIGVDREPGMIEEARKKCSNDGRISFEVSEITEFPLEPCDLIVSYYTIQFVHPKFRQEIINRIYQSLNWGGAFVLFEKVRAPDARFQDLMTGLYTDYKLEQGYSSDEIVSKSRSLKGVLEPFSTNANYEMLERAGFKDYMSVMKYISFEGILAIK